jgi:hypothetical protein
VCDEEGKKRIGGRCLYARKAGVRDEMTEVEGVQGTASHGQIWH